MTAIKQALLLLLLASSARAQYGPPGGGFPSPAMMQQQAQMMHQATLQMQRMQADIMRQQQQMQQQMFQHQMMMNNMMHSQWQMRAHMLEVARSSYRSIMRIDSTPMADLESPYLADDFIERAQQIRTFSVLPVEVHSYLFTKQGYFVKALLDSALQRKVAHDAQGQITFSLATRLRTNAVPIKAVSAERTCQQLESLGFVNGVVPDTTLRALFDCLGTDLLVLPRITVFGVGTRHVDDALEAGIVPDSSNRIQLESNTQGIFYSLEVLAFDRRSLEAEGPAIRGLWRSQLYAKAIVFKMPGAINLKPRAFPNDYLQTSSELSLQLASGAPLREFQLNKLIRARQKEEKKRRAKP